MSEQGIIGTGVSLARTVAPTVPANFISRKHLFHLFETSVPGVTVLAAPAGFGKTTLVAQWAANVERPTIWFTVDPNDSVQSFFAHILQAIRNKIPNFAKNFESEPSSNPLQNIKKLTTAAAGIQTDFNFVIDNGATDNLEVSGIAQQLVDNLPNNVHLVIIRRVTPATSLARYASLGNLSLITSQDLKFSDSEINSIAEFNNANISSNEVKKQLDNCDGWPAAVQMLTRSIARGQTLNELDFTATANPLGMLALETFRTLNEENRFKISRLSLVKEFDLEIAAIILGEDFSETFVNKLATDGMFVTVSSNTNRIYKFNQIVYEVLSQQDFGDLDVRKVIHGKLAEHYLSKNDSSSALEHIYKSGNTERFREVLEISIREMAAIGRGDLLIKWSEFSADNSQSGELMKKTIKVVGHLVNLDFDKAEAIATELEYASLQSDQLSFLTQLTSMIFAHVYFARGEFSRSLQMIDKSLNSEYPYPSIENTDRIALLRIKASIHFLYDEPKEVLAALTQAREFMSTGNLTNAPYHLTCITSLALWCEGRFFEAAEHASIAINQANLMGYSAISAPHDAMLVLARCQLELSQLAKATETLTRLGEKSSSSEIWPWFFMAEGTKSRINITRGKVGVTLEAIKNQRDHLATLRSPNELGWMIDMTEVFLRFVVDDFDRAEELLQRMPKIEMVRQIELNVKFKQDPKKIPSLVDAFPESTPREKVNKYLYQATINIAHENLALNHLVKALEVGSEVGFHEYFVRQHRLYPLMVKAAAAKPTVFRESVVNEMTERIKAQRSDSGSLEEKLTSRELEILKHLTTGIPISAIAKQLHISQNTMKTHLRNVYRKLSVDGRHSAVEKAQKLLLI